MVSSNFLERFKFERKLESTKTRINIMLSVSLSSVFPHKVHNIRFGKQIRVLFQIMVPIKLGPLM